MWVALAPLRLATAMVTAGSEAPLAERCDTYEVRSPKSSRTSATLRRYTGAPRRVGLSHPSVAPYDPFPSADGTPVLLTRQRLEEMRRMLLSHVLATSALPARPASTVTRKQRHFTRNTLTALTTQEDQPYSILEVLFNMQTVYGDPRYRPSPWLRRRGAIGLSLLHTED